MNLFAKLAQRAEKNDPVRVGMIGAGKFGTMFLSQAGRLPGIHLIGVADLSPENAIDGVFGQGFFGRLAELPAGVWTGPVKSGYGAHLVRILGSKPATMPQLDDVRDAVLRDWKAARAIEIREAHYAQLRERYAVEIQGANVRNAESR